MNCQQFDQLSVEYIAGGLDPESRAKLEAHLAACPTCRQETDGLVALWTKLAELPDMEPSADLDARFNSMVQGFRQGLDAAKPQPPPRSVLALWIEYLWPSRPLSRLGLAVLLLGLGVLAGRLGFDRRPAVSPGGASEAALARTRQELAQLKEEVALALLEQPSASERLRGVECTGRLPHPEEQVLAALVRALDSDPNVNVRLAAVGALQQFAAERTVKRALLESLPRQESPLVQVALINLMVELDDQEIIPTLKALLEQNQINDSVRERAEWGLRQLG